MRDKLTSLLKDQLAKVLTKIEESSEGSFNIESEDEWIILLQWKCIVW